MSNRSIPILISLMTLSLIGIMFIQYKWIDDAVGEKERAIDNNVMLAVANVEQQLNDLRVFSAVPDSLLEQVLVIDELQELDTTFFYSDVEFDTASHTNISVKVIQGGADNSFKSEDIEELVTDGDYQKVVLKMSQDSPLASDHDAEIIQIKSFVNRMRMEIGAVSNSNDIRLDSALVIQELNKEFSLNNLGGIESWGIYDRSLKSYHVSPQIKSKSDYSIPLFSTDLLEPKRYQLELIVNKGQLIWTGVWTMILLSLLFLSIILVVFLVSIRLILKHQKISQIKSDFINNMTHEFKTPLASISLAADSLMHPNIKLTRENVKLYTGVIKSEKTKLNKYVERILEVASLEKDKLFIDLSAVGVGNLLSTTLTDLELLINANNVEIDLAVDSNIEVMGNQIHLQQVFTNVIENSIKYSDSHPIINISSVIEDSLILIKIKDQGIGMTKEQLNNIFDSFYRAQSGNLHATKGFGLGLSYSKMVVEKMGGTIDVVSEPNKGTIVTIKLDKA